jgi:hypothetical protein
MDGNTLTFTADRLDRERAAALDRENEILRSIADRCVLITPERPVVDAIRGVGVWFRGLFARPAQLRFS